MGWDTNAGVGGVGWERSPAARDDVVETSVPGKYRGTCVGWGVGGGSVCGGEQPLSSAPTCAAYGAEGGVWRANTTSGLSRAGWDRTERDRTGRVGSDQIGSDRIGSDRIGSDRIGSDRIGSDRIGSDRIGSDRFGSDRIRWDHLDRIGSSGTRQDGTGEGWCPAYSTNTAHHTAHLKLRQKATLDFQVVQAPPPLLHLRSLCRISARTVYTLLYPQHDHVTHQQLTDSPSN